MAATGTMLAQMTTNPMMREYAFGLRQSMLSPVANFLAPTVEVDTMIGRYKKYSRKHAFSLPTTQRAIGGRAVEITFGAEDGTYQCQPHAVDVPVDKMVEQESVQLQNWMKGAADMAAEVAALQHEKRVIDLAIAGINSGSANATIKPYKTTSPDDPVAAIDSYILESLKAARTGGTTGIRVLFGATAWQLIKNCSAIRNRVITSGAGGPSATGAPATAAPNVRIDTMRTLLFGEPECALSMAVYDSTAPGVADSASFVLDSDVLIFPCHQNPSLLDPSFMKTFRLRGEWMVPGMYERDDKRVLVASFDWVADVVVTYGDAGRRITVSSATS